MLRAPDIILDEFVRLLDPIPWYEVRLTNTRLEDLHPMVMDLVDKGDIRPVGRRRSIWEDNKRHNDWLYGPTHEGLKRWRTSIRGKRRTTLPFPAHSLAQRTAAMSPVDVFDLPRVPWKYSLKKERE